MLGHYLKIAWRNLLKYRTQTAVNIVGLAVGFACFAFSLIWIRYELTYDRYHKGAERLYLAYRVSPTDATGYDLEVKDVVPLLRESFPEVEDVCGISRYRTGGLNLPGGKAIGGVQLMADSAFMQMFGVRVLAGDADFLHNRDKMAVTEDYARRLFGTTDVVGKEVQDHYAGRITIGAVLSSLPHSSLAFDYCRGNNKWYEKDGAPVLIRLRPGADIEAFARKAQGYKVAKDGKDTYPFQGVRWMPLTRFHYSDVNTDQSVRFTYLVLFAGVGLLVILGSLLNYLALFVTRMRIREREIGLRRVNGASRWSLFVLFATEYALLIVAAGLVGMTLVEIAFPAFRQVSGVGGGVYGEAFLYFLGVLALSLLMLLPFVLRIKHKAMGRDLFRPLSIGVQIAMGVLFTFATVVLMKQLYFLRHTDLGWERKNIAVLHIYEWGDKSDDFVGVFARFRDDIARLACVGEVLDNHLPLLEASVFSKNTVTDWEEHRPDDEPLEVLTLFESSVFTDFYGMTLLQGRMMSPTDQQYAVLNETAARLLNLRQPVGTHITVRDKQLEVIGLLKDFHYTAPTVPVQPMLLVGEEGLGINAELRAMGFGASHNGRILVKYTGSFADLREAIQPLAEKHGILQYELVRTEDLYQAYLQSETMLLGLLGLVSVVCIVVSAFGIFSMVTLSCERRRKEIAIRKVNGARVGDILRLFAREYLGLLVVACVVAFPVGYVLMRRWLESYVEQTPISVWIYLVIFAGMALLIALCIGWRVWRAANENPAEVVKSE